jgi:hypothetical protein
LKATLTAVKNGRENLKCCSSERFETEPHQRSENGRKTIFTEKQERELCDRLLQSSDTFNWATK